MGLLTKEMIEMIDKVRLAHIATADKNGVPHVSPKGSLRVIDDNTLAFNTAFDGITVQNLRENNQIAIAVTDREVNKGLLFLGTPSLETSGEVYDKMVDDWVSKGRPKPANVYKISLTEVRNNPRGK